MNATLPIYSLSGTAIATAIVTESAISHEELMTADYVQLSWNSDTGDTLPAGAYITIGSERYSLLEPYTPTRANEAEYQYTPQFQSRIMAWQKHIIPLYTYDTDGTTVKTREMDWDFTGSPADAMYMVQQAIRNETGEQWAVQLADSLPATITISSQSGSIFSVLNDIAGQCETEWWTDKVTNTLYLAQCKHGTAIALTVGDNVGVPNVTPSQDGYYTRFYVFGSTRNVTQDSGAAATNSVVNKRLTLDPATYPGGYIDARPNLQQGEIFTKTLFYDDIYPSSKLAISDVRARLKYRLDGNGNKIEAGTDDSGQPIYEQYAIWYFKIAGFDFDPTTIIPQMNLSAHFEDGQLAGRDFELTYHDKEDNTHYTDDALPFVVEAGDYEIMIDESEGTIIPGLAYIIPQDGDKVILYNIEMPAEYTASAQQELAERAQKDIAKMTADNKSYEMDSYPTEFEADDTDLTMGQAVTYTNGDNVLQTRVLMVEKHLDYACQQRIRIGNEIIKGNTQQLREEMTQATQNIDILAAFNNLSASVSNAYAKVQREMLEGFARIGDMWKFDPDDPTVIYSKYSAYVNGFFSAKGKNPDAGSTPGGATTLAALTDVAITGTPQDKQVLAYDATLNKWTPTDMEATAGIDEQELLQILTEKGYATQQWVTGQLAGYVPTSRRIIAGTGLAGGGTLAGNVTLSLATVGTAGTYTKVTVDQYGRVTGHGSLAAGDIPALDWGKITTGKPTTLAGYGITDAYTRAEADSRYIRQNLGYVTDNKDMDDFKGSGLYVVSSASYSSVGNFPASSAYGYGTLANLMWASGRGIQWYVPDYDHTMAVRTAWTEGRWNNWHYLLTHRNYNTLMTGSLTHLINIVASGYVQAGEYIQVGDARLYWDAELGAVYVQRSDGTACGFYATGFISAKGKNSDAGAVAGGSTTLSGLEDVSLGSLSAGQVLSWDGSKWTNAAKPASTWNEITGKPSWIGSTKPTYTAAEVGALTQTAADGRYFRKNVGYVGNNGDLNGYATSGLYFVSASSPSSIENYPADYGYAVLANFMLDTGRGMQMLMVDDNTSPVYVRLSWNAGTWRGWRALAYTDSLKPWSEITGTPTTLAGYGITDAPTKTGGGASGTWGIGISGNAATATKLQTARTISLTGDATGSATFDGSANAAITVSVSHADDADTLGGYAPSKYYRKNVANAVTVGKALSALVATNNSADAWNAPENTSLMLANNNNALAVYVGGTQNERAANIQVGHLSTPYASSLGKLFLNRLGGNVIVGNPSDDSHRLSVAGGVYASSYVQIGNARLLYDAANNALYVQKSDGTVCGFYATGFLSAKGLNSDAGSASAGIDEEQLEEILNDKGYATQQWVRNQGYLKEADLPEIPDLTGYATQDWVTQNYAKKSDIPSLAGYATQAWVNSQGFLKSVTWGDLTSHPTTLAGYGITDAYTKSQSDGRYVKKSGDTMTGTLEIRTAGIGTQLKATRTDSGTGATAIAYANTGGTLGYLGMGDAAMFGDWGKNMPVFSADGSSFSVLYNSRDHVGMVRKNVDLTSYPSTNFYPFVFDIGRGYYEDIEVMIYSAGGQGSADWNANHLHFVARNGGWSDSGVFLDIINHQQYSTDETTIGCIGRGTQNGTMAVWLRGGVSYVVYHTGTYAQTVHTTSYATGGSTYTVGTSMSGGTNTNVAVWWSPEGTNRKYFIGQSLYAQSVLPLEDNTYSLGSTSDRWARVYAVEGVFTSSIKIGGGTITWDSATGGFHFSHGLYSDSWISAKGKNSDAGSVEVGLSEQQLQEYLTEHRYATQDWVTGKNYITAAALNGYATQTWVTQQNFAKKSDIPSLTGYATQNWVTEQNFLKSVELATISDLHASWDALLKAAPSQYVTRWPNFSEVTGTPSLTVTSSSGTNLTLTVEGATKTVADLYATYADQLRTARTISLAGAVTGSTSFNGSTNATITTSFNASELLSSLKTVDGSGSGLDADLLDGYEATDFYRKKSVNTVTVAKALSVLVATNNSDDAWNAPENTSLMLSNNNNALAIYVGGTMNERTASIQVGHNSYSYAQYTGKLFLNRYGGNVILGNPTYQSAKLCVAGVAYASTGIFSDGYVSAKGQNTSSDLRLKTPLGDPVGLDVEQIARAPLFLFRWKDGTPGVEVGSSAQYWQGVLPAAVKERGGWLEMAYGNLALAAAITTARTVVDHEARIKKLEEENMELKNRLEIMERRIA